MNSMLPDVTKVCTCFVHATTWWCIAKPDSDRMHQISSDICREVAGRDDSLGQTWTLVMWLPSM